MSIDNDFEKFKNSKQISAIKAGIEEVLDFYDFKKSRGSDAGLKSCIGITDSTIVRTYLETIHQLSKIYNGKKELLAIVERIAEMED